MVRVCLLLIGLIRCGSRLRWDLIAFLLRLLFRLCVLVPTVVRLMIVLMVILMWSFSMIILKDFSYDFCACCCRFAEVSFVSCIVGCAFLL